jgi:outer membrane receptor protein involved in Fe transport
MRAAVARLIENGGILNQRAHWKKLATGGWIMNYLIKRIVGMVSVSIVCLPVISAYAQEDTGVLEEIIVTAQKRQQSLQDVPISVSVLSGAKLEEANIENLDDLALYVPNFSKGESGAGAIIQIRGIGTGSNAGFEQSVVMYMDDIALGRNPLARMPMMDLERVEVLRGPQNVLFGKNSIAGAISLVTAKPTDEVEGSISLRYEPDYGDTEGTVVLSGPLSDSIAGRLAVRYADYGGYYYNSFLERDEEQRDEMAVRGTLRWEGGDNSELIIKFENNTVDGKGEGHELIFGYDTLIPDFAGLDYPGVVATLQGLYNFGIFPPNPAFPPPIDVGNDEISMDRVRRSAFDGYQELDLNKVQVTYNQDFDNFTFTSVTGYIEYEEDRLAGGGLSGIDISSVLTNEEYEQISQEFRLTSTGDGPFQWIAGGYFQTWELSQLGTTFLDDSNVPVLLGLTLAPGLEGIANLQSYIDYDGDSKTYAAFGQVSWSMSDRARITLGGRYTHEIKNGRRFADVVNSTTGEFDIVQAILTSCIFGVDYDTLGQASAFGFPLPDCTFVNPAPPGYYSTHDAMGKRTEDAFTPSLTLEFDVGDDSLFYVSASQGFKAGGFDASAVRESQLEYEEEEVLAYELGLKSSFAGGRAQTNIAVFSSDYDDLQSTTFDGTAAFFTGNAAEYQAHGVEFDGRWRVTDNLTLAGSFAYIDGEFGGGEVDSNRIPCNVRFGQLNPGVICYREGRIPGNTPEWSGTLIADLVLPITSDVDFRATLDVLYEDEYFTEPTKEVATIQDAYTKFNLRLALEGERWTLAVLGKNLSDEDVLEFSGAVPLSGPDLFASTYYGYLQPPRTISAQFDYRF